MVTTFSEYILKKDVQGIKIVFLYLFSRKFSELGLETFSSTSWSGTLSHTQVTVFNLFTLVPLYFGVCCFCALVPVFLSAWLQMFGAVQGDAADPATQQPSPVSSQDPSAAPRIPRAKTRWKKAAIAGEQCFGNKTPSQRLRRDFRRL